VDWNDLKEFTDIDVKNPSEDDDDLIDFYSHKYNISFYGEDIGIPLFLIS
jgi:hypothetical protein